jgi:hypothetical protein
MPDDDIGAEGAGGRETDLGASASRGRARSAQGGLGDGQATRRGESPVSEEDAARADVPREGTPEDLRPGSGGVVDGGGVPGSPSDE